MGNKKQTFRLKWQVYVVNIILALIIGTVYSIFQYAKEFFTMYATINQLFTILQIICVGLIGSLFIMVCMQYVKAGKYTFYENGLVDHRQQKSYFYHDIMTYQFEAQNNKEAKSLTFTTDTNEEGSINALVSAKAYDLFQKDHAAIWGPFLIQKIDSNQTVTFDIYDDITSFKHRNDNENPSKVRMTHNGLTLYDEFYAWQDVSRYEVSWTGMMSIKDKAHKTIWMEPIVCVERYYDFVFILNHYMKG